MVNLFECVRYVWNNFRLKMISHKRDSHYVSMWTWLMHRFLNFNINARESCSKCEAVCRSRKVIGRIRLCSLLLYVDICTHDDDKRWLPTSIVARNNPYVPTKYTIYAWTKLWCVCARRTSKSNKVIWIITSHRQVFMFVTRTSEFNYFSYIKCLIIQMKSL